VQRLGGSADGPEGNCRGQASPSRETSRQYLGAIQTLVEDARRKKLLLQTGYVWRCHEGVNTALDAARKGWLGDVLMVRGTMNADRDAEQRAVEAKYKGGGLFELGGHVSTERLTAGPAKESPKRCNARATRQP
jgi:hypothetical protein